MNQTRQGGEGEGDTPHEYASPAKIEAMGTALYNTLRKKKKKKPPPEVRCRPARKLCWLRGIDPYRETTHCLAPAFLALLLSRIGKHARTSRPNLQSAVRTVTRLCAAPAVVAG